MCTRQIAIWRSRRGLLELDLLLRPFVENRYDALSCLQKRSLHEMLNLDDVQLLEMVRRPQDAGTYKDVVRAILDYRHETQRTRESRD